jgi:cytochrome c biogenesis protein CcmG/thiol:disulfide interchange protein DsbE
MNRYLVPLVVFFALLALLGIGLRYDPHLVPSPLIDKPAPAFALPQLHAPDTTLSKSDLLGQVTLLNVWASWCVACRDEHPVLLQLAKSGDVPIYGLDYKDERSAAVNWLDRLGNPYARNAFDADGRVGIDFGVYGVPETFVVDAHGIIRYKHIGPLTDEVLAQKILPLVKRLEQPRDAPKS